LIYQIYELLSYVGPETFTHSSESKFWKSRW
jgi:hypothetical protein